MGCSVGLARVIFFLLFVVNTVNVVVAISRDKSPFRREIWEEPWMKATLIDFYVNVAVLSAWVMYKESRWLLRLLWIVILICTGSSGTCLYVLIQLGKLSSSDPAFKVLLDDQHARWLTAHFAGEASGPY
ncbi:hypothetical protein CBR_g58808 [Chara braunii]|uniref:DUF1475 domain-containing protein n=1 Tax=Chara braunii TaxID=69332 RepID=A0A388K8D1_CHABU|nr:hypothetical protein CBR_g58808 [Chara braunii]|eukprot:GBG66317.1 hypothetical protein CBR_g58808 [Chara braunii]